MTKNLLHCKCLVPEFIHERLSDGQNETVLRDKDLYVVRANDGHKQLAHREVGTLSSKNHEACIL